MNIWEVCVVQNVCYAVKYPSCQPFAMTVNWIPAKRSIRLSNAVSQRNLVHGNLLAAGMFAPTHSGCWHLQPWWLSHFMTQCKSWANTWGSGEGNISTSIRALCTKSFWRRHRETFLDHLGGVDTFMGGAPVPKLGLDEQIHGEVGRSISQLLLGLHAPNFLEVHDT